ncbi:CU044_5270 family protein [Spirillospora sp. NPDC050679]
MNELNRVRALLREPPSPSAEARTAALTRLEEDFTAGRRRRPARPPLLSLTGLTCLLAAGTAAAVAVAVLGAGDPASSGPSGPQAAPSARSILLAAAGQAERQPAATGRYWRSVVQDDLLVKAGPAAAPYKVVVRQLNGEWTPADPKAPTWSLTQDLGARPATPADEAAWKRAGSPSEHLQPVPEQARRKTGVTARKIPAAPGPRRVERGDPAGARPFFVGRDLSLREILALPADPERLRQALVRYSGGRADSEKLFEYAANMVLHYPATPKARAAAFRMMAGLDGVRALGRDTDDRGRAGQAVSLQVTVPGVAVTEWRLIVDPAAGRALAWESRTVRPLAPTGRKGERTDTATVVEAGWTDAPPSRS